MVSILPVAIFFGAAVSAVLAFFAFFGSVQGNAVRTLRGFGEVIDRAGIRSGPEQLVFTWLTAMSALWIVGLFVMRPGIVVGLLLLPLSAAIAAAGLYAYIMYKLRRRTELFLNQFELVLRLMASGLRSGLGLQQTIKMVIDESPDPAKHEFARVLGQANIGTSVYDALDDLSERMPLSETLMLARVVRVNSQTGGDLARVVEQLANTIRDRRRLRRKISSMTSEGRAGAIVLVSVPLLLGLFIMVTQQDMSHGLLHLHAGHIVIGFVLALETLGILSLNRILKVAV